MVGLGYVIFIVPWLGSWDGVGVGYGNRGCRDRDVAWLDVLMLREATHFCELSEGIIRTFNSLSTCRIFNTEGTTLKYYYLFSLGAVTIKSYSRYT